MKGEYCEKETFYINSGIHCKLNELHHSLCRRLGDY